MAWVYKLVGNRCIKHFLIYVSNGKGYLVENSHFLGHKIIKSHFSLQAFFALVNIFSAK